MPRLALISLLNFLTSLALVVTSSKFPATVNVHELQTTTPSVISTMPTPTQQHGPRVDLAHSGNVSTVLGQMASLRCRVLDRANKSVSWIRHRDLHLLTVGQYTYTTDHRFQALHESSTGDWVLLVASVQRRDQGVYECQIGTTPPKSHFVTLNVLEPRTEILGGRDLHINTGSTINLTCLVINHPRTPTAVTWIHQGKEVHYDSARGGVSVVTEAGEVMRSALLIQKATAGDAGNYTCMPTGVAPATARVHVLLDEQRAAIQGGVGRTKYANNGALLFWAVCACLWSKGLFSTINLNGEVVSRGGISDSSFINNHTSSRFSNTLQNKDVDQKTNSHGDRQGKYTSTLKTSTIHTKLY